MNKVITIVKRILYTVCLIVVMASSAEGQKQYSNSPQTIFDRLQTNLQVELSGSIIATTHGMQFTFPAFWVAHQVKVEPLVGFFWEDFTGSSPATGIRLIYYFKRQSLSGATDNAFYAGLSGMSSEFIAFGRDVTDVALGGLVVGHTFGLNESIELNPEVLLGFDESSDFQPAIGASLVIHFGR